MTDLSHIEKISYLAEFGVDSYEVNLIGDYYRLSGRTRASKFVTCCSIYKSVLIEAWANIVGEFVSVNGHAPISAKCAQGHLYAEAWSLPAISVLFKDGYMATLHRIYTDRLDGPAVTYYDGSGRIIQEIWIHGGYDLEDINELDDTALIEFLRDESQAFRQAALSVYMTLHPESNIGTILSAIEAL